jgi:hypothetical protein
MTSLTLKRASASRPDGQWSDEDYDVLADGKVVGRILAQRRARPAWCNLERAFLTLTTAASLGRKEKAPPRGEAIEGFHGSTQHLTCFDSWAWNRVGF